MKFMKRWMMISVPSGNLMEIFFCPVALILRKAKRVSLYSLYVGPEDTIINEDDTNTAYEWARVREVFRYKREMFQYNY
jgi:hypothetical protein